MRLTANTATLFAAVGAVLAAIIALPVVGWYWVFLPGSIAALVAVIIVSTWLGQLASTKARGLLWCIAAGVGIALATLLAGVVALGVFNVFLSWLDDLMSFGLGLGNFHSIWHALEDYMLKPIYWVFVVGGWIATVFGVVYGIVLYFRAHQRNSQISNV